MRTTTILDRKLGALLLGSALISSAVAACSDAGGGGQLPLGGSCPDDLAYFEANIWKPVMSQQCAVCHSEDGLAKNSRMVLRPPTEDGYLEANFEIIKSVAAIEVDGTSVLLLKPSGRHKEGHTGGTLIPFNGAVYKTFDTFVGRVTKGKGCEAPAASCTEAAPGGRVLRRLSRSEYDATIRDLFKIDSAWGASFTSDTVVNGFDNNAEALRVTPLLADQARRAAEEIADIAVGNINAILPCQPAAGAEAECAGTFIDTFGERVFRRPLSENDHARYLALYNTVAKDDGFQEGVKTIITAMLQSPHFLYRSEIGAEGAAAEGGRVKLTAYEIASELSYFIWGSMPDAELFAAAKSGALAKAEEIEAQARRLLADPKADVMINRFMEQWLELDRLPTVAKDAATFPEFDANIRTAMREEAKRFVRHVVRESGGTLPELMTASYTFMDPALAAFYGVPAPSGQADPQGFAMVDVAAESRAGILTLGGVLATQARPNASSPIHRGKLVRERLLCQELPPPPPGLNVQPPPVDPSKSTRERYEAHSKLEPCVSCHKLIDPIGFGFEHFDGVGRFRELENNASIDATGEIVATAATDGSFEGTVELAKKLSESDDAQACFARQWFRFAYGLEENAELSCLVDKVGGDFAGGDLKIEELIVALTRTAHFAERMADGSEGVESSTSGGAGGTGPGTGAGGGSSSSSGSGGPAPNDGIEVVEIQDSKWATGYCNSVKVTNKGAAPVEWVVKLKLEGTLTDAWNAIETPEGDYMKFVGENYNKLLDPGAMTSFGFCASL